MPRIFTKLLAAVILTRFVSNPHFIKIQPCAYLQSLQSEACRTFRSLGTARILHPGLFFLHLHMGFLSNLRLVALKGELFHLLSNLSSPRPLPERGGGGNSPENVYRRMGISSIKYAMSFHFLVCLVACLCNFRNSKL